MKRECLVANPVLSYWACAQFCNDLFFGLWKCDKKDQVSNISVHGKEFFNSSSPRADFDITFVAKPVNTLIVYNLKMKNSQKHVTIVIKSANLPYQYILMLSHIAFINGRASGKDAKKFLSLSDFRLLISNFQTNHLFPIYYLI